MSAPRQKDGSTFFKILSKFCTDRAKIFLCAFKSSYFSRAGKLRKMGKHAYHILLNTKLSKITEW